MRITKLGAAIVAVFSASLAFGQMNLNFTQVKVTSEGAIQLFWNSTTNELYEIDYADSLIDTNTGFITWNALYADYPSHGTNTFIGDFGNYSLEPPILHPNKMPMRFYRVYLMGTNTAPQPTVSITSPTNGAVLSGVVSITVSSTSDFPFKSTTLYVDGQQMPPSPDGTNYTINTCEWPNGPHTLFATARTVSKFSGIPNDSDFPTSAQAVSAYVNPTFDNLITRFAFSEPYFDPSAGQTQHVSAVFAAGVNWTLQIQNESTNTVRFASGAGASMAFDWDGTGTNGASLPNGVYTYLLTVQTNGQTYSSSSSGSDGGGGSAPPSPSSASATTTSDDSEGTRLWVQQTNGVVVPFALFPPGFDTNDFDIFEAPDSWNPYQRSSSSQSLATADGGTAEGPEAMDANTPTNQAARAPTRPPTAPVKGFIGTFGLGHQTYYTPSGRFNTPAIQKTPPPIQTFIALDGRAQNQANLPETWGPIPENKELGDKFIAGMKAKGWMPKIIKTETNITGSDLTAGTFNQCNVALLSLHTSYSTTSELDGIYHTYIRFLNNGATSYVKTDDCSFGGSGTNGLKWIGFLACNLLRDQNYSSMYNNSKLPINNDLHLLLSSSTFATAAPDIGKYWPGYMLGTITTNNAPETVKRAWFDAGQRAYTEGETNHLVITFRVAGWPDAFSEYISDVNTTPGTGNPADITKQDQTVFNNP